MHLQLTDGLSQSFKVKMSSAAPSTLTLSRTDAIKLALAITMSLAERNHEEIMKAIEDSHPTDIEDGLEIA